MALEQNIAVLIGGVGGAKLASGLAAILPPQRLTFIVNTGDDFWHLGLKICPDLDTLMYTLAGLGNPQLGWGLQDDSLTVLTALQKRYGFETWFRLGDQDLATHLLRSHRLRAGESLTATTRHLCQKLGVQPTLLPMCDAEVPTLIDTAAHGELGFQEYFVKHRWQPALRSIRHSGCEAAQPSAAVRAALQAADVVLLAPSNPWLSIAPILSVAGMRELLQSLTVPVVAVTPVIGGAAVKGPTAKIMRELGLEVTAENVALYYQGIISGFVNDRRNRTLRLAGLRTVKLDTLMHDINDKIALARSMLDWIGAWGA